MAQFVGDQGPYFSFVSEDLPGKLRPLAMSHLSIGQFEPFRAALHQLPPDQSLSLLRSILASGPEESWHSSISVPSAAHLQWLCSLEYDAARARLIASNSETTVPAPLESASRETVAFDILLHEAFDSAIHAADTQTDFPTPEWLQQLRHAHDNPSGRLGDTTELFSAYTSLLGRDPFLAGQIASHLFRGCELRTKLWTVYISRTESLIEAGDSGISSLLLTLPHLAFDTNDIESDKDLATAVEKFSKSLANACLSSVLNKNNKGGVHESSVGLMKSVFEALLACPSPVALASVSEAVESLIRDKVFESDATKGCLPVEHSLLTFKKETGALVTDDSETMQKFWKMAALAASSTGKHFVEHSLERAVSLLSEKEITAAAATLSPYGDVLKPLAVLLGWDIHGNDSEYRTELVRLLWKEMETQTTEQKDDSDKNEALKTLEKACDSLSYLMWISQWAAKVLRGKDTEQKEDGGDEQKSLWEETNETYTALREHSIPFVVQNVLSSTPLLSVIDAVEKNPDESSLPAVKRDVDFLRASHLLRCVLSVVKNEVPAYDFVQSTVDEIALIVDPSSRLLVLQFLFSSLFWQKKDPETGKTVSFSATTETFCKIVDVLKASVAQFQESQRQNPCLSPLEAEILNVLSQDVEEARFRAEFASSLLNEGNLKDQCEFVRLILASPDTLLALAVQRTDHKLAKEISDYFSAHPKSNLSQSLFVVAQTEELLSTVSSEVSSVINKETKLSSQTVVDLCKDVIFKSSIASKDKSVVQGVLRDTAFSLLFNAYEGNPEISSVLREAGRILLNDDVLSSSSGSEEARLSQILASLSSITLNNQESVLSDDEFFGCTGALSGKPDKIKEDSERFIATEKSDLKFVELSADGSELRKQNEETQKRMIREYLEQRKALGATDSPDFVEEFLVYLQSLSEALPSQTNKVPKYFDILTQTPTAIVADLVFSSGTMASAQPAADLLHFDLDTIIVREISASVPSKPETEPTTPSGKDSKLNLNVAKLLATKWPSVAAVCCITRFPIESGFPGDIISFGFNTAASVSPASSHIETHLLSRWFAQRRKLLDLFTQAFFGKQLAQCQTVMPYPTPKGKEALAHLRFCTEEEDCAFLSCVLHHLLDRIAPGTPASRNKDTILQVATSVIQTADKFLEDGVPDDVLNPLCDAFRNCTPPLLAEMPILLMRFHDRKRMASIVLGNIQAWNPEVCIRLLSSCCGSSAELAVSDQAQMFQMVEEASEECIQLWKMQTYVEIFKTRAVMSRDPEDAADIPNWMRKARQWQELEVYFKDNTKEVISSLVEINKFDIARRVLALFKADRSLLTDIEESRLIYLLITGQTKQGKQASQIQKQQQQEARMQGAQRGNVTPQVTPKLDRIAPGASGAYAGTNEVARALHGMGENAVQTVEALLKRLEGMTTKRVTGMRASLFCLDFVLSHGFCKLTEAQKIQFSAHRTGLRVLLLLPHDSMKAYFHLARHPKLILENMIIDRKLSELGTVLRSVPEFSDEKLFITYANKALGITITDGKPEPSKPGGFSTVSLSVKLTGNEEKDNELRKLHCFPGVPNVNLAKSLLDFCKNPVLIGNACLQACESLSTSLKASTPRAQDIIDVITHILRHGKSVFSLNMNPELNGPCEKGASNCDDFLKRTELFSDLLRNECTFGLSLKDFLKNDQARWLRDRLIKSDLLQIAIDVATLCNIGCGKIWSKWGFSMLHLGNYSGAREKFNNCLRTDTIRRTTGIDDDPEPDELIAEIISTLESEQQIDEAALRCQTQNIIESLRRPTPSGGSGRQEGLLVSSDISEGSGSGPQSDLQVPDLTPIVLNECKFYLETYGKKEQFVTFLMRYEKLEDACRYVFDNKLPPKVFVEEIVYYCIVHSMLSPLQVALDSVDPERTVSREYIAAACRWLSSKKAHSLLLNFYLFLHEYSRAGLAALNVASEFSPLDFNSRRLMLETARENFEKAVQNPEDHAVLSMSEKSMRLRGTKYMLQMLDLFEQNSKKVPEDVLSMSVFDSPKNCTELCKQCLLLEGYSVALSTAGDSVFNVDCASMFAEVSRELTRGSTKNRQAAAKLSSFIKNVRGGVDTSVWDGAILASMEVYLNELKDKKSAIKLMDKLCSVKAQVRARAMCGDYKEAFKTAAQQCLVDEVEFILSIVEGKDAEYEKLCKQFLESQKPAAAAPQPPDPKKDFSYLLKSSPVTSFSSSSSSSESSSAGTRPSSVSSMFVSQGGVARSPSPSMHHQIVITSPTAAPLSGVSPVSPRRTTTSSEIFQHNSRGSAASSVTSYPVKQRDSGSFAPGFGSPAMGGSLGPSAVAQSPSRSMTAGMAQFRQNSPHLQAVVQQDSFHGSPRGSPSPQHSSPRQQNPNRSLSSAIPSQSSPFADPVRGGSPAQSSLRPQSRTDSPKLNVSSKPRPVFPSAKETKPPAIADLENVRITEPVQQKQQQPSTPTNPFMAPTDPRKQHVATKNPFMERKPSTNPFTEAGPSVRKETPVSSNPFMESTPAPKKQTSVLSSSNPFADDVPPQKSQSSSNPFADDVAPSKTSAPSTNPFADTTTSKAEKKPRGTNPFASEDTPSVSSNPFLSDKPDSSQQKSSTNPFLSDGPSKPAPAATTANPFDEPTPSRRPVPDLSNPFLTELQNAAIDDDPDAFTVTRAKRSKKPKAQTIFTENSGRK